jgi:hypothetical protein
MIIKQGDKVVNERYYDLPPRLSSCGKALFSHYHRVTNRTGNSILSGQGVNDSDYAVTYRDEGLMLTCPTYKVWSNILKRVQTGGAYQKHRPTYSGSSISPDWINFLHFKKWIESVNAEFRNVMRIADNDPTSVWSHRDLDKDLLSELGNKIYSPQTCLFITPKVNSLVTNKDKAKGALPVGLNIMGNSIQVRCNNQLTGVREALGCFPLDQIGLAEYTYKVRKFEIINEIADQLSLSPFSHDRIAAECLRILYPLPTPPTK